MHLFNMATSYNGVHGVFVFDEGDLSPKKPQISATPPNSDSDT
jgi:hypothetical protein